MLGLQFPNFFLRFEWSYDNAWIVLFTFVTFNMELWELPYAIDDYAKDGGLGEV